jgi:hypothetical protein
MEGKIKERILSGNSKISSDSSSSGSSSSSSSSSKSSEEVKISEHTVQRNVFNINE